MHTGLAPCVLQSRGFLSEVRCGKCPNTDTFTYTVLREFLVKLFIITAELADAADSKSAGLRPLGVRFPLPAPFLNPSSSPREIQVVKPKSLHCAQFVSLSALVVLLLAAFPS